jgi:hypothetical protein
LPLPKPANALNTMPVSAVPKFSPSNTIPFGKIACCNRLRARIPVCSPTLSTFCRRSSAKVRTGATSRFLKLPPFGTDTPAHVFSGLPPSRPSPSTPDVYAGFELIPVPGGYTEGKRPPEVAAGGVAGSLISGRSIRPPKHAGRRDLPSCADSEK